MPSRTFTLGYSPCPNDTFIFYALVHKKIKAGDLKFAEMLEDVETLNQLALRSELDITKVSFHAYGHLQDNYCLLHSGGALGKGCGPLVVANENYDITDLKGKKIAVPGMFTTAFLLLQIFDISLKENIITIPFNKIIDAVKNGDVSAGLVIHESRFTYEKAGLKKIIDLGEWWESKTDLPVPLGGIAAKRILGNNVIHSIDMLLRKSIEYALSNKHETTSYIKKHSQEMEDAIIEKHINLYVNNYSLDLGNDGIQAVERLFEEAAELGIIKKSAMPLFSVK